MRNCFKALQFLGSMSFYFVAQVVYANDFSAYLGLEARYFFNEPLWLEQDEHSASLSGYFEYYKDLGEGGQRVVVSGFGRVDSADDNRTHLDAREAYWWADLSGAELFLGVRKIFWGVTESIHLVDVINQDDLVENIDGEDKLGQPMLEAQFIRDWGTIDVFVLPYFREKTFPSESARLRAGVPILDDAVYQSDKEEHHVDLALRWSTYVDIWDIGISHFSGTNRDPLLLPHVVDGVFVGLMPHYQQIEQTGLDVQATINAWLLKLEAISVHEEEYGRNTALVGGIEYTFFTLGDTNMDLGVIAEYQFDDRIGVRKRSGQNDIALGARLAFNDVDATEFLAIFSQDLDDSNQFVSFETSKRFTDNWRVELEARFFNHIENGTMEYDLREDDYLQLEVRRYF
ncbi:hypothetical protein [Teredinibacter sp. KSP-S5-2]|uniref:hypothetical protein n=1 Tax=Teredinibacter sp. KSP-S5-2 TaxID=3034506 RepID=UPI00293486EC|nr:hypothetical protein [Teredinibacter sp. KSP-S5-2]WNO07512.1 hypothetical protein P5V12_10970 [Teredinibacter sp. KSP-S5-2]